MTKVLLATTMLAALLAACGDSAQPQEPEPEPTPVASLVVTAPATELDPGATLQLTATPLDADGEALVGRAIAWASSNPDVAVVTATGLVEARAAGVVVIAATSEGVTGDATLTVRSVEEAVASLEITSGNDIVLAPGATVQLDAAARAADGSVLEDRLVTWASGHVGVATVSPTGLVTAHAEGGVWITARCEGQLDEVLLGVRVPVVPVAWIEITAGAAITLDEGTTRQLEAIAHAADGSVLDGRFVGWWSTAPAVATVNDFGVVTARGEGTATIWADVEDRIASVTVTVEPAVEWVELSHSDAVLVVDGSLQLEAWPRDLTGLVIDRTVTWQSDHPEYASVGSNGLVLAHAEGGARITATSGGKSASLVVHVTRWAEQPLLTVDGAALPAQLYSYTEVDEHGAQATLTFVAHQGVLRMHGIDPRYELVVFGWLYVDGQFAIAFPHRSDGTWTATPGGYLFHPDLGASFPGTFHPDGSMSVVWQADDSAPAATLVVAPLG